MITPQIQYDDPLANLFPNLVGASPVWSKNIGTETFTPNAVASPDGTLTGFQITTLATANSGAFFTSAVNSVNGKPNTYSLWMRASAGTPTITITIGRSGGAVDAEVISFAISTTWQRYTFTHSTVWTGSTAITVVVNQAAALATTFYTWAGVGNLRGDLNTGIVIFSYPPVQKPGADDRVAVRNDSVTSSGLRQSIYQRTDVFRNVQIDFVPQSDLAMWQAFIAYAEQGGPFFYYADVTLLAFNIFLLEDTQWIPARAAFGFAKFKMRMRFVS